MTLQDLGSLGEFVGALAVVLSLVYLAWQIRQNTIQLQQNAAWLAASASQNVAGSMNEWSYSLARDPALTAFLLKGLENPKALDGVDNYRFFLLCGVFLRNYDVAFHLNHLGFVADLDSLERSMKAILSSSQMREWWQVHGQQFDQGLQDRVNRMLEQSAA